MPTTKVSVIVPVYNVANYISQCANSLIQQTLDSLEIIFVDDASTDASAEFLSKLKESQQGKTIKIIHHSKNLGSGASRRSGIEAAMGQYVIFCDGDDWVDPQAYETMFNKALESNADIVACEIKREFPNTYDILTYPYDEEQFYDTYRVHGNYSSLCNKLIRKDLFTTLEIQFPDQIRMWDDNSISFPIRFYSKKTVIIHQAFYHYRCGDPQNKSICTIATIESRLQDTTGCISHLEKYFNNRGDLEIASKNLQYLKIQAKDILLSKPEYRDIKRWKKLYPRSTNKIISDKRFPIKYRIKTALAYYLPAPMATFILKKIDK